MDISKTARLTEDITDLLRLIDISTEQTDPDTMEINFNKVLVTFGRVQDAMLTMQKEIEELQHSSPGSGGTSRYVMNFSSENWTSKDGKYILKILPTQHHLGTSVTLSSILKDDGTGFEEAFITFKVYVDGTIIVTSELTFTGRLAIDMLS